MCLPMCVCVVVIHVFIFIGSIDSTTFVSMSMCLISSLRMFIHYLGSCFFSSVFLSIHLFVLYTQAFTNSFIMMHDPCLCDTYIRRIVPTNSRNFGGSIVNPLYK